MTTLRDHRAGNPFGETPMGLVAQIMNLSTILLRPFVLRIPPFQRPYTWSIPEVAQLLEDLTAAYKRNASFYFIGQIVFVKAGREFEISDGQQRLTTLTMILAFARDRLPQHADLYQSLIMTAQNVGRIRLRPADAEFFHHWVQTPGRMLDLALTENFETDAQECMIVAARVIADYFDDPEYDNRKLDQFIRYIARAAIFNVIDADEPGAAITVFETTNTRGMDLSGPDILKGALLASPELTPADIEAAAAAWDRCENRSGREAFARLLRYAPQLLRTQVLISPGDVAALVDTISKRVGVRKFITEWLPRHCDAHRRLCHASVEAGADSADVNRRIKCLHMIHPFDWEPLAIAYLANHGAKNARRFFLLYERFIAASTLNVLVPRVRRGRVNLAWANARDETKMVAAFELTEAMLRELRNRVGRSSKKDQLRRYLVLRINAALGEVLLAHDEAEVEHILPQTPTAWWRQHFRDPKRYSEYANMVGNYVLVTEKQNEDAGNKTFPEKREVYFNKGYPVRAITRDIEGVQEWNEQTLGRRHEGLCRIMGQEWELTARA